MKKNLRRIARELALRNLYAHEMGNPLLSPIKLTSLNNNESILSPKAVPFATLLTEGVLKHLGFINKIITISSANWRIERMSYVDRNILRIAVFEIFFLSDIPAVVAINEAIEISKEYSEKDAPSFINGVLDRVKKEYESGYLAKSSESDQTP